MKKILLTLSLSSLSFFGLQAEEAACPRCEEIREYNKTHHKNYEYYEDYLKQGSEECNQPGCAKPSSADSNNQKETQPKPTPKRKPPRSNQVLPAEPINR